MLPWQQTMLEQWDSYTVDQPAALKRKALIWALAIYGLICSLFFIPHIHQAAPATVFIHGATAPVLFMGSGAGNGKNSARLQKHKKALEKKPPKKEVPKKSEPKPEPRKAVLPVRKSVVKEQKPKQKSKKELLAEKQKAAAKTKADKAKKLAEEKKLKEKAEREKKAHDEKIKQEQEKLAAEQAEKNKVTQEAAVENQEIIVGAQEGDGNGVGGPLDPALKSHMALGRAITRVWRPPQVKIANPVRVVAQLSAAGAVKDAQLQTQSGVVAYDIAARAAVLRAEFPKEFWGKSVILVFGS